MDWKKISNDRLRKIRVLERRLEFLKTDLERQLERELRVMFHAGCYPRHVYEPRVEAMAHSVAQRIVW